MCSTNGGMGKDYCPNKGSCNDGSILQPSPKMPSLSFGGGSHLGVPCRGAVLGRVELEGGKNKFGSISKRNEGPAAAVSLNSKDLIELLASYGVLMRSHQGRGSCQLLPGVTQ